MLRIIFIFVISGSYITCNGDTSQDDWINQGLYRPRRNFPSQSQNQKSFQSSYSQNDQNKNAFETRETSYNNENFGNKLTITSPNRQNTNAFNRHSSQNQNTFGAASYTHSPQTHNQFGASFIQNSQRQGSFGTSNSQNNRNHNSFASNYNLQNQNSFGASLNSFETGFSSNYQGQNSFKTGNNQNPFGDSNISNQNQNSGASYLKLQGNAFGNSQDFQRRNPFPSSFNNVYQFQNASSNSQVQNFGSSFGSADNQNTYKAPEYLPPLKPFIAPNYLPAFEDPKTSTTKRPFYTTSTQRPYYRTTTTTTRRPIFTTTTRQPFYTTTTRKYYTTTTPTTRTTTPITTTTHRSNPRPSPGPAMAMPVPPEPECDPTDPSTYPPGVDQRSDDPCTPPKTITTTTPATITTTTPATTTTTTTSKTTTTHRPNPRPPVAPAMAMPVPPEPECDPTDPSTYPPGVDQRSDDPCTPPETITTTTPATITTTTPATTKTTTTPITTTTHRPNPRPPPAPAMAMPVPPEPECDPTDPSTYPPGVDQRSDDPCTPPKTITTTTPVTTTTTTPATTTTTTPATTTTTTPATTTTTTTPATTTTTTPATATTTTPATTTTTHLFEPCKCPNPRPPPAPAMAMPVPPEPECDPTDPSTYPPGVDQGSDDPCTPPNTITTTTPTTTTKPITKTTHLFDASKYLYNIIQYNTSTTFHLPQTTKTSECLPPAPKRRIARSSKTLRLDSVKGARPVWHVGIYDKTWKPYRPICGGSIVSMDVVISAAHCFWEDDTGLQPAQNYAVGGNKIYRPWAEPMDKRVQQSDIIEIKIPPRFRGVKASFQDDLAVLKLASPFKYAKGLRPVCVDFNDGFDRDQLKEGNSGTIAGWGYTDAVGSQTSRLLWLELPYVEIERCIAGADQAFLKYITSDKVCAGENMTGKALCRGDSGGGLVFWDGEPDNATPYLRAIASTAPSAENLECNVQAVGTFTEITSHKRFLKEHIPGIGEECHYRDY